VSGGGSCHIWMAGQELGVVIPTTHPDRAWAMILTFRPVAVAVLTLGNEGDAGRNVHQQPVEEIHSWQVGGHRLALLVHVVRHARYIRIKHHHYEAFSAVWCALPDHFRIPVRTEAHVVLLAEHAERKFPRNRLTFLNTSNLQFHVDFSCLFFKWVRSF